MAGTAVITLGTLGLFVLRWAGVPDRWLPLTTHLDGLLLISALLGGTILFIQSRPRLRGLAAFGLPMMLLAMLWAICAANWTYQPFDIAPGDLWLGLHLIAIYTGTVSAFVAAIAGCMYLFIQRRLRQKMRVEPGVSLASLETLESVIVRMATLGFALLTLGLVSGLVIITERSTILGPTWYASPKIWLAAAAWAVYALVMNIKYATAFRGARAAYLSIAGLVLLLATYGVATAIPGNVKPDMPTASDINLAEPANTKEAW